MKSYVHFIKKARMTTFLSRVGYFRCSRYGKFLISNTDLFSRIYALKKILPTSEHEYLKHDLQKLIQHSKINIFMLKILPNDWESRYDNISSL